MPNLTDIKIPITGSQALTPSETPVQGVGATPVLPGSMPEPELSRGRKQSSIRPFNISEYENILGRGQVNPNLDLSVLNENRAQNQSGWYLTKNAIGQLGTTILGGTITDIGSILNFFLLHIVLLVKYGMIMPNINGTKLSTKVLVLNGRE